MAKANQSLDFLFHPRSIALVGITTTNPEHWTRAFFTGLLALEFPGRIYLVNPKGGEIEGHKVLTSLQEVTDTIDYEIGLVNAQLAPQLIEESAAKGVRAAQFCTAGFSETGEEEGIRLEAELVKVARAKGIRVIGPNCMGIYSPKSRMSFSPAFPKESGPVGLVSQSGGNAIYLVRQSAVRGVHFSKVISYGNACDLNESDFVEYLADDPDTKVLAMYIEGIKDGNRFRKALEKATKLKTVILLKGGLTEGGARAVAGHTAALAGSKSTWNALCKQLGIIQVEDADEMIDVLVTLLFLPRPKGRRALLMGSGGGASVLITDDFERRGLKVPPLPPQMIRQIREFTPAAGNILRNPVDYSQAMLDPENVSKTLDIISKWEGADFMVKFIRTGQAAQAGGMALHSSLLSSGTSTKSAMPVAVVIEPTLLPGEVEHNLAFLRDCVSSGLPVYYSFPSAAKAIDLVLSHDENKYKNI